MTRLTTTGWLEGHTKVGSKHYVVRVFPGTEWIRRVSVFLADHQWQVKSWVPVVDVTGRAATLAKVMEEIAAVS